MAWNKMDWNKTDELKDHWFYLVTHKDYKTPMKAKWHCEDGGCWKIRGCPAMSGMIFYTSRYDYSYDTEHYVTAWMELPDIYKEN